MADIDYQQQEQGFRRRWYLAHVEAFTRDSTAVEWQQEIQQGLSAAAPEGIEIIQTLQASRDLDGFLESLKTWSLQKARPFNNFGQMFMNQVVNYSTNEAEATRVLSEVLNPPSTAEEALAKITRLAAYVETVKRKGQPARGRVPFCLSFFWSLYEESSWPVLWASGARFAEFLTGQRLPAGPAGRYEQFVGWVGTFDDDHRQFERLAAWWDREKTILVDPVLVDRCAFRCAYRGTEIDDMSPESGLVVALRENAEHLVRIAQHIGNTLRDKVSDLATRDLTVVTPGAFWPNKRPRGHLQVDWQLGEQYAPGLRIWINPNGMTICLQPGIGPPENYGGKGTESAWYGKLVNALPEGFNDLEVINVGGGSYGMERGFLGRMGSFVYGKWYRRDQLENLDVRAECEEVVPKLRPVLDRWMDMYHGLPDRPVPLPPVGPPSPDNDDVADLAQSLLVPKESLDQIIRLLEDKGQVILYGPPGTGKTYLAKRLAECLAPEDDQRAFLQFHPSMSYEDFFEGYRPETDAGGAMTYRLTPGPLRNIAKQAAENLDQRHIMIIDEINRANLPKVLGELLFLLEYRKDTVLPLYRPTEPFGLPPNLWLIGTMNTADRSIAAVDAALRRRFHFVPFFPHQGPMEGLLERWLEANGEGAWLGKEVVKVNQELAEALGGPHLQLGPSNFMKEGITDLKAGKLEMVWRYTVEPFIEEQFFDDPDRIARFRWETISKGFGNQDVASPEDQPTDADAEAN